MPTTRRPGRGDDRGGLSLGVVIALVAIAVTAAAFYFASQEEGIPGEEVAPTSGSDPADESDPDDQADDGESSEAPSEGTDPDGAGDAPEADPDGNDTDEGQVNETDADRGNGSADQTAEALDRGDTYLVGAWLDGWPSPEEESIRSFEDQTGTQVQIVDIYLDWSTSFAEVESSVEHVQRSGAMAQLTWEAHGLTTKDIADGSKQVTLNNGTTMSVGAYLDSFGARACQTAQETGTPILVRPLHEMNGDWFSWGIAYRTEDGTQPNTNESYKAAWQRIHAAFTEDCSDDEVRFVWAVNHNSGGTDAGFTGTYPGDAYVDYLGVDGYNWGSKASWGWQPFDEIMAPAYCAVTEVSDKPVLLAEWGSVEAGGDKAAWIEDAFTTIHEDYPRIRGMVWLDTKKHEEQTGETMDWRVDSSPEALEAYSQSVQELKSHEPLEPVSEVPRGAACS